MSKRSARYTAAPDSFVGGPVAWGYARHDSSQNKHEDGVVIIPPVAELLAFDRVNQFDGVEIDIDGEHVTDEEQLAESVLPFDWSSFYYLPSVFKFDGKVRVGSDHGIDFDGPVRTVEEYFDDLVKNFGVVSPRCGRDGRFTKFAPKTAAQAAEQIAIALRDDG
jgi:hypothetical protein